jgi:thioesterase domain-containing protein/acyl carrier protein
VKLRGYRIEPGEIEACLRKHANIRSAVVLLQEHKVAGAQLVGYVVARQMPAPEASELRAFVRERLPEYMVPSSFHMLKVLPLTANGKIDRQKLLTDTGEGENTTLPLSSAGSTGKPVVLPRDTIELHLLQIWEELLQRQPISVTDNFFDLGGHSILVVRLISRIYKELGKDIPLATLFQYPTVADLATVLRQQHVIGKRAALVPIQPKGELTPLFCIHPAGGTVFCYISLSRHLEQNRPVYGLQMPDGQEHELTSIEAMAAHYISELQAIQPEGPYLLAGWSMGGVIALEMAQQLLQRGSRTTLLAILDSVIARPQVRQRALEKTIEISDEDVLRELLYQFRMTPPADFEALDLEQRLHWAIENAKEQKGIPIDTSLEQLQHFVRMYRTNSHIAHLYVPQSYPHRIDYFVSERARGVDGVLEEMSEKSPKSTETADGPVQTWRALAQGEFVLHRAKGDHSSMVEEPQVRVLAEMLQDCIDQAQ